MANLLLISVSEYDTRVAFLEDGRLVEFCVENRASIGPVGNIYKGRVLRLLPGMAAAFVDVGLDRPAYLFAEDVSAQEDEFFQIWLKGEVDENSEARRRPDTTISDLLHEGQEVLVQVLRGPTANKGARVTTQISLAGHYLVYLPTLAQLGVSRRIAEEPERQRIKAILEELQPAEGGLIARTASRDQSPDLLARERDSLLGLWQRLLAKKTTAACPSLLHQELEAARRVVRELYSPEVDRVLVDNPAAFERIAAYLESFNPLDKFRVELYTDPEPIFSHFGLEIDWGKILAPRVWLKSGGYLHLDPTEALTAIDVNTGRFVGRDQLEDTILQTNLEAAGEIARQLRLRNIGGLIVIDFIDQEKAAHRDLVYKTLVEALSRDRAKTTVLPISPLGLVEMTRQRLRDSLAQTVMEPCGACGGRGLVLTSRVLAGDILRQLAAEAREFPGYRLSLAAHPSVTRILDGDEAGLLSRLTKENRVEISLSPQPQFERGRYEITREWVRE
jgi:ribonuclease G